MNIHNQYELTVWTENIKVRSTAINSLKQKKHQTKTKNAPYHVLYFLRDVFCNCLSFSISDGLFFFLRIKSFHLKILTRCEFQTSKFGNVQIKNCYSSLLAIIITVNTEVFDYFTLKLWRCSTYIWPKSSSGPENLSRHLQDPQNLRSQKFYTILVICLWSLTKFWMQISCMAITWVS